MKDLKDYIKENRELFDDREPSYGHMARFEALLDKNKEELSDDEVGQKPKKRIPLIGIVSVAASIALIIGLAFHFSAPGTIDSRGVANSNEEKHIQMSDEFRTTNEYYNRQMSQQISDIMCKLAYTDVENQAQLTKDIQKIVDSNKDFVKDMSENEDEGLAIHFLVKHYEANIQVLENINEKLGKYTKC